MRLLPFIFLLAVLSCRQTAKIPDDFDYGKIENGVYKNNYFDFEIAVPDSWHVQNKEQIDQIRKTGNDMLAENNRDLAEKVKASLVRSVILLTAFKHNTDSVIEEYNPSFMIMGENVASISSVKKGREYLINVKKIMEQTGMNYTYPSGFYSEKVGNKNFDAMDVVMTVNGIDVEQTYYSMIYKNFAFSMIISFIGKEQKKTLKSIINKIKFN